jgi:hypothetical protein
VKTTKLHIHWDGDVPGLAEHRLSLDAFGEALQALASAARRIASGLVKDAVEDPNYGQRGGRLAEKARLLDLEIAKLGDGSLGVDVVCRMRVPQGANIPLFDELPGQTVGRLLEALEQEGRGQPANAMVRKYLSRLPQGLTKHRYEQWSNGSMVREVNLGAMKLPEIEPTPPCLMEMLGTIVGLGLEASAPEVRIASDERKYVCAATMLQVERAIELHKEPVRAMVLMGTKPRLLWIRPMRDAGRLADEEARTGHLMARWEPLLRRLAQ